MAPSNLQHRRTHNLLLISKLLNPRDAASPFTLILDSLEQSGVPLVAEYVKRAKAAKVQIIFVSFQTLKNIYKAEVFVEAWRLSVREWQEELSGHLKNEPTQRKLIIIDSLNTLSATQSSNLPGLLSSFISPTTSLLATYHTDIPEPLSTDQSNPYAPSPLSLLKYLATTIISTHSLHHILATQSAKARSQAPPSFGLEEGIEGVVQGLGSNGREGLVLEMEHRRKSGRGVREWYYLPIQATQPSSTTVGAGAGAGAGAGKEKVMLLEDHPAYAKLNTASADEDGGEADAGATFEMGLTEKQRADREGVVLPYFDAQRADASGEGGRILYDMGSEDDFDEEEDEI